MATHSSTLAWKIPWMEEPGRLQSMGLQRVRHDWVTSMSISMLYYFVVVFPWVWVKIIVDEVLSQLWLPSPRKNVPVTILIWSRPPADHPDCCSVTELLIWRPRVFPISLVPTAWKFSFTKWTISPSISPFAALAIFSLVFEFILQIFTTFFFENVP